MRVSWVSARPSSRGGDHALDAGNLAVGGADHEPRPHRRHPLGIAEKIDASERQDQAEPAERRRQHEQDQCRHGKAEDKFVAVAMGRHEGAGDAVENAVTVAHSDLQDLLAGKGFVIEPLRGPQGKLGFGVGLEHMRQALAGLIGLTLAGP